MDKKCIFITGAASGIGRETALFFAKKGWFTGIVDVNEEGLKQLETKIGPANCHVQMMDVTDPENVQNAIDTFAAETGGRMDVLLNNAGIIKFGFFETVDIADHLRIVDVNFKGCLNCIYYSLKYLRKTPGARIINMSSASALYGIPDVSVYSATKHALSAFTEALDFELEESGVTVCDIRPPYVNTPLLETKEDVFSIEKMGIKLEPQNIAESIWKAAHKHKLHWNVSSTGALGLVTRLFPFATRWIIKTLMIPPKSA
jgi:NADP-dependent 3-hydroxy acid dehydrogenase YdfG